MVVHRIIFTSDNHSDDSDVIQRTDLVQFVGCNSCRDSDIEGLRYKCLMCWNYDMCARCYRAGICFGRHRLEHPVQCVITVPDEEDDRIYLVECPFGYTCPHCKRIGFDVDSLIEHLTKKHCEDFFQIRINCPVCAVMIDHMRDRITDELIFHLRVAHSSLRVLGQQEVSEERSAPTETVPGFQNVVMAIPVRRISANPFMYFAHAASIIAHIIKIRCAFLLMVLDMYHAAFEKY